MRYRIIDMDSIDTTEDDSPMNILSKVGKATLSEEETMDKFHEVYKSGYENGIKNYGGDGFTTNRLNWSKLQEKL